MTDRGTFIELVTDRTTDPEVRDFQQELKQYPSHTLADSMVRNLTLAEYHAEKERYRAGATA